MIDCFFHTQKRLKLLSKISAHIMRHTNNIIGVQDNISHSVSNVAVVMFLLCFKLKCYIIKIKIIHKLDIQIAKNFF
jgi:hypothetical protein